MGSQVESFPVDRFSRIGRTLSNRTDYFVVTNIYRTGRQAQVFLTELCQCTLDEEGIIASLEVTRNKLSFYLKCELEGPILFPSRETEDDESRFFPVDLNAVLPEVRKVYIENG